MKKHLLSIILCVLSLYTGVFGQNTACTPNAYEPNNTALQAVIIPSNVNVLSAIDTAGDIDFFKVTTTASNPHIRVSLTNLPFDCDIFLYNMNADSSLGAGVGSGVQVNLVNELIDYRANNNPATYLIKVIGFNRASSATQCYTLNASLNNDPALATVNLTIAGAFNAPATLTLNAATTGIVSRVEFYNGQTLLGVDSILPYSIPMNNVGVGTYTLSARAYQGATYVQSARTITIFGTNDAGIASITSPRGNIGEAVTSPVVMLKNAGGNTLTSVIIKSQVDGNTPSVYTWSGNLIGSGTTSVTLGQQAVSMGTHTLKVWTETPNNVNDTNSSNDTLMIMFSRVVSSCPVGTYEPNNTVGQATALPLNVPVSSMIDTSGDVDYYRITTTAGQTGVRLSLTNLPYDYDLFFYNANADGTIGTQISTSMRLDTISESIIYNGNPAIGTYYIRVIGFNRSFSTAQCYTLLAETFNVTTTGGGGQTGSIVITAPADSAVFDIHSNVTFTAQLNGIDSIGACVYFFNGNTQIGLDLTAPYSFTWRDVAVGTYTITAKVIDRAHNTWYSVPIRIIVVRNGPAINDAGIATISSPPRGRLAVSSINPVVLIRNYGDTTLTRVKVNYKLNNGSVSTFNWTGNLLINGVASVTLPTISYGAGTHILTVYTSEPNNTRDFRATNDTLRTSFMFDVACGDVYEPNNAASTAATIIPNSNGIDAMIERIGDLDYYTFTTLDSMTKIKITLTNLAADYDVKLMTPNPLQNGALKTVAGGYNTNTRDETVVYNNGRTPATYYVQVYGFANSWSNLQCYHLKVETRAVNYLTAGTSNDVELSKKATPSVNIREMSVYPNPAQDALTVAVNVEQAGNYTIQLTNLLGKIVVSEQRELQKGANNLLFNIQNLTSGVYLTLFNDGTQVITRKFIKE